MALKTFLGPGSEAQRDSASLHIADRPEQGLRLRESRVVPG